MTAKGPASYRYLHYDVFTDVALTGNQLAAPARRCSRRPGLTSRGVFVFSTEPGDDQATAYSRMLTTEREDPATGSASGPLGCYLVRYRLVPSERAGQIVSRQGVKMGRPSRVHIRIAGTPDRITDVKVGGASLLVGDGRMTKI